ncbi:MAG: 3'-5' exonuclease [Clostridia bacterium]|nr:3'-5' exonuclease [Clostridia bacterium]
MILYFDTETSGLRPGQICQLSYLLQTQNEVTAKNFFFTVDSVEYGAYMVHGFSVDKLRKLSGGKRFADHIDEIEKDFLSSDMLVSHNTAFDFSFMRTEFERLNRQFIINGEFCTMKKSTPVCKLMRSSCANYKYPKLAELCDYFGITVDSIKDASNELFGAHAGYHDARFDTVAVYLSANTGMKSEKIFKELEGFL